MAELADALGLGSSFFGSEGSSPFIRILLKTLLDSIQEGFLLKPGYVGAWLAVPQTQPDTLHSSVI